MVDYLIFFGLFAVGLIVFGLDIKRKKGQKPEPVSPYIKQLSRCESPIERRVFKALSQHGYNVMAQYTVDNYRIDIYLPEYNLGIECDGKVHKNPHKKYQDQRRQKFLHKNGHRIIRFSGSQINRNLGSVVRRVNNEIKKAQSS